MKIVRTCGQDVALTQWKCIMNNKTYKLYPKTFLFLTSIGLCFYLMYQKDKKEDDENKQRKLLNKTHDNAYDKGRNAGIKFITNDKISADTLKPYVDMAVFLEQQKQLQKSMQEMEKNREHYRILLNNLQ